MSLASKVTLVLSCAGAAGIIYFVHHKQWSDKQKLHEGVIRDIERQQRRKVENLYVLQQQIDLGKALKKQEREQDALQLLENSKSQNIQ